METKPGSLQEEQQSLAFINKTLQQLPSLSLHTLPAEKSALIIIDMNNGFAKKGALYSPDTQALIPGIARLSAACGRAGMDCLAFTDAHTENALEFSAYPPHCIAGSWESELVEELNAAASFQLFYKNSTNGFHNAPFQKYLSSHPATVNFILAGDCTDICVFQMATTLKAWFNEQNLPSRVIVPVRLVDTFDSPTHSRVLWNAIALYQMLQSGIEIVTSIDGINGGEK